MKKTKKCVIFIIALSFVLGFIFWNSMSLSGNWLSEDGTVSVEWHDYKGISHSYEFSESESTILADMLRNLKAEKHFYLPESNTGELSYNINYISTKNVGYIVRSSGWVAVFNKKFPFQHSVWNAEEGIAEIIDYIILLDK